MRNRITLGDRLNQTEFCELSNGTFFRYVQRTNPENIYLKYEDGYAVYLLTGEKFSVGPGTLVEELPVGTKIHIEILA